MFSIGITDYFFPTFKVDDPAYNNNYFDYDSETTGHYIEANLGFSGTEGFPVSISANVFFYGADKKPEDPDDLENTEMVNAYSTYIEIAYSGELENIGYSVFVGLTPNETSLYSDKAGLVHCGLTTSKELKFTDSFSLPVSASFIINPNQENVYFVFGISL